MPNHYYNFIQCQDVFDITTGLWTFGKSCTSQERVSNDPFDKRLPEAISQREKMITTPREEAFSLVAHANGPCECKVNPK